MSSPNISQVREALHLPEVEKIKVFEKSWPAVDTWPGYQLTQRHTETFATQKHLPPDIVENRADCQNTNLRGRVSHIL